MKKFICSVLGYFVKKCRTMMPPPECDQIKRASQDVAWEYVAMLAAALKMAEGANPPTNHLVQVAFLTHLRNLAEFFDKGVPEFKKAQVPPPRPQDNIYAVDFCLSIGWPRKPFGKNLIKAINKTLSHMTYSRDPASQGHAKFEGYLHVHGTVTVMRRTWGAFMNSVRPEFLQPQYAEDIAYWLVKHTEGWPVRFKDLEHEFEALATQRTIDCNWTLNQTPDGPV